MEKNKPCFGDRKISDTLQTGWFCSGAWLIRRLCDCNLPERDSFFSFRPAHRSRGRPSFSGSRKEEDYPTRASRTLIQCCLLSWVSVSVTAPGKIGGACSAGL
ncbi:hypothetical protein ILYODFUR_010044 [Ilyodon furcidens]|uniref:Uncharacterized protein n=1 Tax=Ilyodon furcidens TaxID=33524 RepID=A0ABV0V1X6_9TELE